MARAVGRPGVRGATTVAVAVAVAHGLNDVYTSFLHPLLPRIMQKMGLSIALAATLATVLSLAASLLQPLMGYLADRFDRRVFVILGPVLSGVFLSLIGVAPTYAVLVGLLVLGGLGSSAFHPPGASMATGAGRGTGSGIRYSLFSFGGAVGYAAGPLIAVALVAQYGLGRLWLAMLPVLIAAPLLAAVLPADARAGRTSLPPSPRGIVAHLGGPLGLVFGISAVSTFVQRTYMTMEPIAASAAGASEAVGALMLTAYLAGQAGGSLVGGWLADRVPLSRLLASITLASLPSHLLAIALPPGSALALAMAAIAGCASMALLPPIVVTAQEILPSGTAVGSGIVMGLAWATGSLGVLLTGVLGDVMGARDAALVCTPAILAATLLALHPTLRAHGRPVPAGPVPPVDGAR
jgi:FSR family fosmidomycin resistance protein-like MFS transporter